MLVKHAEIDLSQPIDPIYVEARYDQLSLVVLWGYIPLGTLHLATCSATRIFSVEQMKNEILQALGWRLWTQAIADGLNRLERGLDPKLPPVSVVVCTRDRPLSLERCLQSLTLIDYPEYEVLVVDNGSRDPAVKGVVERSGFRCVHEGSPGLDRARNRGIKEATHDLIAFIDDDALASRGWLRGLAQAFEGSEIMAVTGLVLPIEIETTAQSDFERYGGMNKGFLSRTIRRDQLRSWQLFWASNWGVGANMAFRRSLFTSIGSFDVALDVGMPANGGGDIEFFYRTVSSGYALRYEPAAMVYHVHRRDALALKQQIYNNGRSFGAYLLTIARNEPHNSAKVLQFAIRWWLWKWLLRRLLRSLIKGDRRTFRFALTELRGCFSSPWAYLKSRKLASQQIEAGQV